MNFIDFNDFVSDIQLSIANIEERKQENKYVEQKYHFQEYEQESESESEQDEEEGLFKLCDFDDIDEFQNFKNFQFDDTRIIRHSRSSQVSNSTGTYSQPIIYQKNIHNLTNKSTAPQQEIQSKVKNHLVKPAQPNANRTQRQQVYSSEISIQDIVYVADSTLSLQPFTCNNQQKGNYRQCQLSEISTDKTHQQQFQTENCFQEQNRTNGADSLDIFPSQFTDHNNQVAFQVEQNYQQNESLLINQESNLQIQYLTEDCQLSSHAIGPYSFGFIQPSNLVNSGIAELERQHKQYYPTDPDSQRKPQQRINSESCFQDQNRPNRNDSTHLSLLNDLNNQRDIQFGGEYQQHQKTQLDDLSSNKDSMSSKKCFPLHHSSDGADSSLQQMSHQNQRVSQFKGQYQQYGPILPNNDIPVSTLSLQPFNCNNQKNGNHLQGQLSEISPEKTHQQQFQTENCFQEQSRSNGADSFDIFPSQPTHHSNQGVFQVESNYQPNEPLLINQESNQQILQKTEDYQPSQHVNEPYSLGSIQPSNFVNERITEQQGQLEEYYPILIGSQRKPQQEINSENCFEDQNRSNRNDSTHFSLLNKLNNQRDIQFDVEYQQRQYTELNDLSSNRDSMQSKKYFPLHNSSDGADSSLQQTSHQNQRVSQVKGQHQQYGPVLSNNEYNLSHNNQNEGNSSFQNNTNTQFHGFHNYSYTNHPFEHLQRNQKYFHKKEKDFKQKRKSKNTITKYYLQSYLVIIKELKEKNKNNEKLKTKIEFYDQYLKRQKIKNYSCNEKNNKILNDQSQNEKMLSDEKSQIKVRENSEKQIKCNFQAQLISLILEGKINHYQGVHLNLLIESVGNESFINTFKYVISHRKNRKNQVYDEQEDIEMAAKQIQKKILSQLNKH